MRGGILAAGLFLLIIGIFLYFYGTELVNQVEAFDIYDIPISELLKTLSPDVRHQYELGQSMVMFGSIFGIIGFILCIAGIFTPSKTSSQPKQQSYSQVYHGPATRINEKVKDFKEKNKSLNSNRRCPDCGRKIPEDAKLCPYCGKKFKMHFEEEEVKENKETKQEIVKENNKETVKEEKGKSPKYCPECGAKLDEDLNFCTKCGNKLK